MRFVLMLLLAAGCGGDGEAVEEEETAGEEAPPQRPVVGSCNNQDRSGSCEEWYAGLVDRAEVDQHRMDCTEIQGQWADAPCPRQQTLGGCDMGRSATWQYASALNGCDSDAFRGRCESPEAEMRGVFVPPPVPASCL